MRPMPAPLLPLPIAPADAIRCVIRPGLALLPARMDSADAIALVLAIMLQESALAHRWQVIDLNRPQVKGPARGLAQLELGTHASRGGVWGIFLHPASRPHLSRACNTLRVRFHPEPIWRALETNDHLSAVCARLLLWTDASPLPAMADAATTFRYYLRNWRPGAWTRGDDDTRRELEGKFMRNHRIAVDAVRGARG